MQGIVQQACVRILYELVENGTCGPTSLNDAHQRSCKKLAMQCTLSLRSSNAHAPNQSEIVLNLCCKLGAITCQQPYAIEFCSCALHWPIADPEGTLHSINVQLRSGTYNGRYYIACVCSRCYQLACVLACALASLDSIAEQKKWRPNWHKYRR